MNKKYWWAVGIVATSIFTLIILIQKQALRFFQESETQWVTLAFEDKIKDTDYDYNDFIAEIKISEELPTRGLSKVHILIRAKAKMGGYRSGFFLNLNPGNQPAITGPFNGIIKRSSAHSAPTESAINSPLGIIEIFPDTSKAVELAAIVEIDLIAVAPSENSPESDPLARLRRYLFFLDVTDKLQNRYQIEAIQRSTSSLANGTSTLPLALIIPGTGWQIPKDRMSAYLVYPRLKQHVDYLQGLTTIDSPDWFSEISDPNLIETKEFLFKKNRPLR
ncbi:MAG: hypothetical protein H7326_08910 [Bdellovibrionaceae bacterium]|nr:hypothetical protein [Pseudobdellovibrionaceae bacterium]